MTLTSAQSRRKNLLTRIQEIHDVYTKHKQDHPCVTNRYIYQEFISPRFHVSERQFYRYLNINVKHELRQLQPNE